MSPVSKHSTTRKMIWRDIYMLLAIAGFTVCMALFNGMYPKANPDLETPERVASQYPGEIMMPRPDPGPGS